MEINVLDLFSGIGGFHLGLERAGFKVNSYFSEIDKYAIDVYSNNFKTATYVGSVTDVRSEQLPKIDVITFGSPCQDFSLAGKRKGLDGSRSSLIGEAIRLISECRPSFFIWENVKGTFSSNDGADFWAIIQAFANIGGYRLEWQLLNTKWFLPQNRERIYLVGYLGGRSGQQVFPIGKSNESIKRMARERQTSACITTSYHKGINYDNQLIKVAQTLDTHCNQAVIPGTWRTHIDGQGFREVQDGNCPTIPARAREDGSGQPVISNNSRIRRLTPIECERLQGFPDNWTAIGKTIGEISDTQRYKMCGNAVTVDVVASVAHNIRKLYL